MGLIDSVSRTIDYPIGGTAYAFAKLTYRDRADLLKAALEQERAPLLEDIKAAGLASEDVLKKLRELSAAWNGDAAFIRLVNDGEQGCAMVFRRILDKTFPGVAPDDLDMLAATVPYGDQKSIIVKACNLRFEREGSGDPLASTGLPPAATGAVSGSASDTSSLPSATPLT